MIQVKKINMEKNNHHEKLSAQENGCVCNLRKNQYMIVAWKKNTTRPYTIRSRIL